MVSLTSGALPRLASRGRNRRPHSSLGKSHRAFGQLTFPVPLPSPLYHASFRLAILPCPIRAQVTVEISKSSWRVENKPVSSHSPGHKNKATFYILKVAWLLVALNHHEIPILQRRMLFVLGSTWLMWLLATCVVNGITWKEKCCVVMTFANCFASRRFYSSPAFHAALAVVIIKSSNLYSSNKTSKIHSSTLPAFDLNSKHSLRFCCLWGMTSLLRALLGSLMTQGFQPGHWRGQKLQLSRLPSRTDSSSGPCRCAAGPEVDRDLLGSQVALFSRTAWTERKMQIFLTCLRP